MRKPTVLIILDGWGIGRNDESNPIHVVNPEVFRKLDAEYPLTSLQASGISVGLPWGEVGNSEVGHLTMGAGRVIYQHYPQITMAIRDRSFFENPALKSAFAHARQNGSGVNFIGLLTKANVHASLEHMEALLQMARQEEVDNVKLHLFADGKDSPPRSLGGFLGRVPPECLASLTGRYYAMDRNQNWNLTQSAYEAIVGKSGAVIADPAPAIEDTYRRGLTEEFLPPLRVEGKALQENDAVVFFNFREDSIRQLAEAFALQGFNKFSAEHFKNLFAVSFTRYEKELSIPVAFEQEKVEKPLGKVLSDLGKTQLRLTESYKYAHVTYFFNGYREDPYPQEYRVLVPSLSTPRPEEHPELVAPAITDRLLRAIGEKAFDFILVNYANPDTIGHTANYHAALKATEAVSHEIERLLAARDRDTCLIITSDHGNLEEMLNPETGRPESQHDPNPVPFYLVDETFKGKRFANCENLRVETLGTLADVAPTILELMGIEKPKEMTGENLLRMLS